MRKDDVRELLAAPFLSITECPLATAGRGPILLVGKATAGKWKIEDFEPDANCPHSDRVEERRLTTHAFLEEMGRKPKSAFWRFWRNLSLIGSPVIWSNLAKIGVESGNPQGWYLEEQSELAIRTLEAEITQYKPSLIVLVTSDYAKDQIVYRIWPQDIWKISDYDGTCWIKGIGEGLSVLWTDHPQGKPSERLAYWLEKANWLARN